MQMRLWGTKQLEQEPEQKVMVSEYTNLLNNPTGDVIIKLLRDLSYETQVYGNGKRLLIKGMSDDELKRRIARQELYKEFVMLLVEEQRKRIIEYEI